MAVRSTSSDPPNGAKVAVISEGMGKLLWKGKDPIGQCFRLGADTAPCREVVGIAEDMKFGDLQDDESMQLYLPATQDPAAGAIIVRDGGRPSHDGGAAAARDAADACRGWATRA